MTLPHTSHFLSLALAAAVFQTVAGGAHAVLLAGWDFQSAPGTAISQPPGTPRDFTANVGVLQATSHLYLDGTHGSSSFTVDAGPGNGATELGALNSITGNTAGTTLSTAGGVGSMALFNRGTLEGKGMVLQVSMAGYEFLTLSLAVQRPQTGDNSNNYGVSFFSAAYSTDGITFTDWDTIDTGSGLPVTNLAIAFDSLSAVNNAPEVFVKITVSGSTGVNSTRFDNFQINAEPIPEPTALTALLASGLCLVARRRR